MRSAAQGRARDAEASYRRFRTFLGLPSLFLLVLLLLGDGCQANLTGSAPVASDLFALLVCAPGIVITFLKWQRSRQAAELVSQVGEQHQQALGTWRQREAAWRHGELSRLATAAEWGSAVLPDGTLRTDVFGGSLRGWQALLTTHGTSVLAAQPLLVVDLTGELAGQELAAVAAAAGVPVDNWLLPTDLAISGVLTSLSATQFADALTEAVHASAAPDGARLERAIDTRVLEQLYGTLGGAVTPARLAAAVRAALGHTQHAGPLTVAEQTLITDEVFPAGYRQQIEPNLVRIEAFLTTLAREVPGPAEPALRPRSPAYLTCLALESAPRSARLEVLAGLAIQWLSVQVTNGTEPAPAVIIAGADDIAAAHLERLSAACERRRVPLTLLFRHLRDTGLGLLGGGATAFMRLGNHTEAQQAADYIGRSHTFVFSQLTATLGGSQTHTTTHTEGQTVTDAINVGWNTGWNTSSSSSPQGGGGSSGNSRGRQRGHSRSISRTWSTALSWAEGSNWSNAAASQRVYEYTVEPAVLQNLPDQALLLVTRGSGRPVLQPVECDPAIITLPRVSTGVLPDRTAVPPAWARPGADAAPPGLPPVPASPPHPVNGPAGN